jgi:hypothetical protein
MIQDDGSTTGLRMSSITHRVGLAALVGTMALGTACYFLRTSPALSASRKASKAWSCPTDRLTVAQVGTVFRDTPAPPSEIADDAGRLAVWRENHPPKEKWVFRVCGCGETAQFECSHLHAGHGYWLCGECRGRCSRLEAGSRGRGPGESEPRGLCENGLEGEQSCNCP